MVSIVLVGNFNPAIFTPSWFALCDLLPKKVADSAELVIAHPEITQFRADWLTLEVSKGNFKAETLLAPHSHTGA